MADGDAKRAGESKDDASARPKADAPVRSHEDMGVSISRDLNATGGVARGYSSNMSKLNFSARGRPTEDLAPAAQPEVAPEPEASAPEPPLAPDAKPGAKSWLGKLFSGQ